MFSLLRKRGTYTDCTPNGSLEDPTDGSASMDDYDENDDDFDDGRSKTRSMHRLSAERQSRYHDEPEVDYDEDPTDLYQLIENKDWDGAMARIDRASYEARTWVSRREAHDDSKVRWRLLPIHATCVFRSPLSLIEKLLAAYPDGSQMRDDQGMLPVHLACRNGASKGVVITLLNSFPESVSVKDRKGRIPINLVEGSNSQNREAVIFAMKRFTAEMEAKNAQPQQNEQGANGVKGNVGNGSSMPRSVSSATNTAASTVISTNAQGENEVDYEHRTILFRLVLKKDWTAASKRAAEHPDEAATWIVTKGFNGNLRFLPIHKACVLQPPASFVEDLVASHPDGAKARDQDGWLPLHCACFYGASDDVVSAMLEANPKAAQCKDDEGRLPLHYSCLKSAPVAVVSALLQSFPKGAMSKDDEGRLPIHHACSKGAGSDVIEALLRASPKGAQSKDDQGRLPLHHACRKNASERVIKTLLRVYPRGAQVKDDQDKLPLHYACQAGAVEGTVGALLTTYPESVDVKNGFGYTPLAEARAMGDNPKMEGIITVLESFKAEQDKVKERTGPAGGGMAGGGNQSMSFAARDAARVAELERLVSDLSGRVMSLESILGSVGRLGAEMQRGIAEGKSQGDFQKTVEKFASQLATLQGGGGVEDGSAGGGSGSGATPTRSGRATPTGHGSGRNGSKAPKPGE